MASTPYSSLMARMTQDANDRAGMAGARMMFAYAGGFTVVVLTGAMLKRLAMKARLFAHRPDIGGLASLVSGLLLYMQRADGALQVRRRHRWSTASHLAQQYAVFIVLASILLMVCGTTLIGKTILYFFEYQLGDRNAGRKR